jgi:NADPH-dependent 2,4-dienoyl-CoA reductase/sulfur reductase-like enzyme
MRSLSHYNVIVAGGGPAGIIAAIAAARNGASTLLIEQDSFLGGTAATGLPLLAFHNNRGEQIVGGLPWEFVSTLLETDDAAVIRNVITDGNLGKGGSEFIAQSIPVRPEAVKY